MEDRKKLISRALLLVMGITFVLYYQKEDDLDYFVLHQCNEETGLCSGNCTLGWDGPTCSRRNVAFNQSTTQSSDYSEKGFNFTSGLAVDGRTALQLLSEPYTCTHTTNDLPASWTVTLDAQYNIYRFRIYNRNDSDCPGPCGKRLNGFSLSVGNSSQSYKICYQDNTTAGKGPGDIINGVCNVSGPVFGNTVNISINTSKSLTLCEVQIFVCAPGTYGPECGRRCGNCAQGPSACNTTSGHCPQRTPRCMEGYSGLKCDTECRNNTWGKDCQETCGNCYNKTECNAVTGECPLATGNPRCDLGYTGTDCVKEAQISPGRKVDPAYIGGGVAAAVVLITIVVVVVMVTVS
ncbi:multiple epidermal growth factor-like domains protein 10 [Liolophura sinensis]|uniref:multiple epidermal growth factor-like domains protein 10 n=1 Tax=Liolophura sinensis TaxID=3198878 RepID=UPI0031583EDB